MSVNWIRQLVEEFGSSTVDLLYGQSVLLKSGLSTTVNAGFKLGGDMGMFASTVNIR